MTINIKSIKKGFTLIELLIVIAILGILATSLFGNYLSSAQKGRDGQRKHDLEQLQRALEMFYSDNGYYPAANNGGQILGCPTGTACDWGDETSGEFKSSANGALYMKVIPKDPGSNSYCYKTNVSKTNYQLYAILENTQDIKATLSASCNAKTYNFGVASANSTP